MKAAYCNRAWSPQVGGPLPGVQARAKRGFRLRQPLGRLLKMRKAIPARDHPGHSCGL
jgi:hypothetical protein